MRVVLFLAQYIDAVIPTSGGLLFAIHSWRQRDKLRSSPKKIHRAWPYFTLLLLAIGIIRFIASSQPYTWQRVYTDEQHASAEFPCVPKNEVTTGSVQGMPFQQATIRCDVPYRATDLRLSYNNILPESDNLSPDQRIDMMLSIVKQQGFTILSCVLENKPNTPTYKIALRHDGEKSQVLMRVAITPKAIYRAVSTSSYGFDKDSAVVRFIDSFTVQ